MLLPTYFTPLAMPILSLYPVCVVPTTATASGSSNLIIQFHEFSFLECHFETVIIVVHYSFHPVKLVFPCHKKSSRAGLWLLSHYSGDPNNRLVPDSNGKIILGCRTVQISKGGGKPSQFVCFRTLYPNWHQILECYLNTSWVFKWLLNTNCPTNQVASLF